jgi:hypothetical protein
MLVLISSTVSSGVILAPEAVARNTSPDEVPHGVVPQSSALRCGRLLVIELNIKDI